MNEKFVKVEVLVDTTNTEQLSALGTLLSTIGGITIPVPAQSKPEKPVEPEPEKPAKPAKPNKPAKTPKVEPEKPEAPAEPEKPAESGKPAEPEKEYYTVEEVREKLKEKVSDHREAIKAKLTELGAPNVSSLDPSKYAEFVNFLEGLE